MADKEGAALLVVDDDKEFRESLVKVLSKEKYKVSAAPDGETGMRMLKEGSFSLVLLDLKMPGVGGIEVLKMTRKLGHPPRVVILTAYGEWDSYLDAVESGVFDYLNKPIKREELLSVIKRALA